MNISKLIKKEILFIIISSISVLIALLGLTYGYVVYNSNNTETNVTVGSGDFILFYTDNQVISGTNIEPGWYQTKTITVENRGQKTATYNLIWQRIINGVELEISGTCTSNVQGNTCDNIATKTVPIYSTEATNVKIKRNIEIEAGETQTYVITLRFIEEASLQENYSVSKSFRGTLNINVSTESNLYNEVKTLAQAGNLAATYSGTSNDSYGKSTSKKIYYIKPKSSTYESTLLNSINVKFAGYCWQILRTTDTGGVKLIYNGEYVNGTGCKAHNIVDKHKGIIGTQGTNGSMIGDYMYSDTFTYNTTAETFTLVNPIVSNWSTNKNLVGKYTCKMDSSTSTCTTLYYINTKHRTTANKAYYTTYTIGDTQNAQIGTSPFNANYYSPAYAGYMFGDTVYEYVNRTAPDSNLIIMGKDVYWDGSNYVLKDGNSNSTHTYSGALESEYHYTCNTTSATCTNVRYYYFYTSDKYYYTELSGGDKVEDAIDKMLINPANTRNSTIKSYLENWYYNKLVNFEEYLDKNAVYCSDRSTINNYGGWIKNAGFSEGIFFNNRSSQSNLDCARDKDKFSVRNNNAKLDYPIGLVTKPELYIIGNNNIRKTGQIYWTLSANYFSASGMYINYIRDDTGGFASGYAISNTYGIRPVIVLSNATNYISGNGSFETPYVIEEY